MLTLVPDIKTIVLVDYNHAYIQSPEYVIMYDCKMHAQIATTHDNSAVYNVSVAYLLASMPTKVMNTTKTTITSSYG